MVIDMFDAFDPAEQRRRKRRLLLLLAPVGLLFVAHLTGSALSPTLLVQEPLLLVAMSPLGRHLVLVSPSVDTLPFYAVAVVRLFAIDPFMYQVGREFGQDAVDWTKRRAGKRIGGLVEWAEKLFERWAIPMLFISPGAFVCLFAGVARMNRVLFVAVNLAGTFMMVTIVRVFGDEFRGPIDAVREFVEANMLALTVATVTLVVVSTWWRRRKIRLSEDREQDDVVAVDAKPADESAQ